MIKVYTVPDCKFCKDAKKYLKDHNIEFEELNLKKKENRSARAFYRSLGVKTAPIITGVDKNNDEWILVEYKEDELKKLLEI